MHFIVMIRHVFFVAAILSLICFTVMSFLGIRNSVILSPGLFFLSFSMTVYLVTVFVFDFVRTRNGFGYRFFVFRIWWELTSLAIFTIILIVLVGVGVTKPQGAACFHNQIREVGPRVCMISQGIWTCEILVAMLSFSYVTFLAVVTIEFYQRTPSVLKTGVRDFDWKANLTPHPYYISPYSDSTYTIGSREYNTKKRKIPLSSISRPNAYAYPEPPLSTPVTFPEIRKMQKARTHPLGSRFVEGL